MRSIHLGIIGGCLSHQPGMSKSQLYTSRLMRHLSSAGVAHLKISIARDFDHSYLQRLNGLLGNRSLDAVLVHVRSEFVQKARFIVSITNGNQIHYLLHPFLFRRRELGWSTFVQRGFSASPVIHKRRRVEEKRNHESSEVGADSRQIFDSPNPYKRFAGIKVADTLLFAGLISGLMHWAIQDELEMLRHLKARCDELRLPLFVLGPSRRQDLYWADFMSRQMDKKLAKVLREWSIDYCSLPNTHNKRGSSLFLRDGHHFSSAGHEHVAEQLMKACIKMYKNSNQPSVAAG